MSGRKTLVGTRITRNADNMHGRPCVRGLRVTVAAVLRTLVDLDGDIDEAVRVYGYVDLTRRDVLECISYAARLAADDTIKQGQGA